MIWRVRYDECGGHMHCRLFCAKQINMTFACCGEFTVRNEEFDSLRRAFAGAEFAVEDQAGSEPIGGKPKE